MDLLLKIIRKEKITNKEIEDSLYEICEAEHSSCNNACPVYDLNGGAVPDTAKDFRVNRGCDCFKSGKEMLKFIKSKI